MEQRSFGNTDLSCSLLGFGTWEMGATQYGAIDIEAAVRAVHLALDHGITLFDTAEVYGPYTSEELLARALGGRMLSLLPKWVLSTVTILRFAATMPLLAGTPRLPTSLNVPKAA